VTAELTFGDTTDDLVAGDAGIHGARPFAACCVQVGAADAAEEDVALDARVPGSRGRD
jgi:hypothetical protein